MTISVIDLRDGTEQEYVDISPREAVLAAYAQSRGDYNTWDYEKRYGQLVRHGRLTVTCGDFCAFE